MGFFFFLSFFLASSENESLIATWLSQERLLVCLCLCLVTFGRFSSWTVFYASLLFLMKLFKETMNGTRRRFTLLGVGTVGAGIIQALPFFLNAEVLHIVDMVTDLQSRVDTLVQDSLPSAREALKKTKLEVHIMKLTHENLDCLLTPLLMDSCAVMDLTTCVDSEEGNEQEKEKNLFFSIVFQLHVLRRSAAALTLTLVWRCLMKTSL
jgi:hypothetical protein